MSLDYSSDVTLKTEYKMDKIQDIKQIQNNFLNLIINNNILYEGEYDSMMEEDNEKIISKTEELYEVQYIIKHKKYIINMNIL
jgi:hypothetical protein